MAWFSFQGILWGNYEEKMMKTCRDTATQKNIFDKNRIRQEIIKRCFTTVNLFGIFWYHIIDEKAVDAAV